MVVDRPAGNLHTESVVEFGFLQSLGDVFMSWQEGLGKFLQQGRAAMDEGEGRDEKVAVQVGADVRPGGVVTDAREPVVVKPIGMHANVSPRRAHPFGTPFHVIRHSQKLVSDFAANRIIHLGCVQPKCTAD